MKKTIKILIEEMDDLQEKKDGTLRGGFASLKGGFSAKDLSTNDNCTNISEGCVIWTNSTGPNCSNSGACYL